MRLMIENAQTIHQNTKTPKHTILPKYHTLQIPWQTNLPQPTPRHHGREQTYSRTPVSRYLRTQSPVVHHSLHKLHVQTEYDESACVCKTTRQTATTFRIFLHQSRRLPTAHHASFQQNASRNHNCHAPQNIQADRSLREFENISNCSHSSTNGKHESEQEGQMCTNCCHHV